MSRPSDYHDAIDQQRDIENVAEQNSAAVPGYTDSELLDWLQDHCDICLTSYGRKTWLYRGDWGGLRSELARSRTNLEKNVPDELREIKENNQVNRL